MRRTDRYRYPVLMTVLILLQFTIRGRLGSLVSTEHAEQVSPDFLLLALLLYTIRAEPGRSAAVGFVVGLLRDALTPASFGAGALAHTLVGFASSWAKAVFFAEHVLVRGCLVFAGTWLRNLIVLLASGRLQGSQVAWELLVWSPLQALSTALVGVVVLWLFGGWLSPRRPGAGGGVLRVSV
jgi:rod shape-determining protein MreD